MSTNQPATFLCPDNDDFYAANKYEPLNPDAREIRLLKMTYDVSDKHDKDHLECELIQPISLLSPDVQYIALSYCAGSRDDVETIRLDGMDFNVFKPVALAIRQMQLLSVTALLWIDQLCINQMDPIERGQQVSLMKHIYSQAWYTVAWLGDEDSATIATAFSVVKRLAEMKRERLQAFTEARDSIQDATLSKEEINKAALEAHLTVEEAIVAEIQPTIDLEELRAYIALASRPWWQRCWILQEAILSRAVILLHGSESVMLEDMNRAFAILSRLSRVCTEPTSGLRAAAIADILVHMFSSLSLLQLRTMWLSQQRGVRLTQALNYSRHCKASDPRDNVYSVLGLVREAAHGIEPSYLPMQTVCDTFVAAVRAIIIQDETLDVLAAAWGNFRTTAFDLPSWVPDFTTTQNTITIPPGWSTGDVVFPTGPRERWAAVRPSFESDERGRESCVLSCWAVPLLTIGLEQSLVVLGDAENQSWAEIEENWAQTLANADLPPVYEHTGEPLSKAFDHVVGKDYIIEALQQSPEMRDERVFWRLWAETLRRGIWRFFAHPAGYIGTVPKTTQPGDMLAVLFYSKEVFVLRPRKAQHANCYELVGPAYVHGRLAPTVINEMYAAFDDEQELKQKLTQIRIY